MLILARKGNMCTVFANLMITSFLISCSSQTNKEPVVFDAIDESFILITERIKKSTELLYASFDDKLKDPAYGVKAEKYHPKMEQVRFLSKKMEDYINNFKIKASKEGQFSKEYLGQLHDQLMKYEFAVLNIDPKIKDAFDTTLFTRPQYINSILKDKEQFSETLSGLTLKSAIILIDILGYNIKDTENRLLLFFHGQVSYTPPCEFYLPIVAQNKSIFNAGEEIEITAGVGNFLNWDAMEIKLNGRKIATNSSGIVTRTFSVSSKPGNHFVPVDISYFDQDGKKNTFRKTVKYTVEEK